MVRITEVSPGSLADKHGILAGDELVDINNSPIRDVLDYRFYLTERSVTLRLLRNGESFAVSIRKREYDDIGLSFATPLMDEKQRCKNGCVFCFIDQNPKGMRDSIYCKDDDSRLSFLHGNYITMTNMTDEDAARIVKMRFSPINVSIHTTNPELRVKMMKNKRSGEVLRYLDDFRAAGLKMHGQIVLCRGVNDGEELRRTLSDLSEYYPELESVSVVPAGLTKHREGLYPLSDFTPCEAREIIDTVNEYAEAQLAKHGSRQFFAADELYLKAGISLPKTEYYEDYSQIENGVGMLRSFSDECEDALSQVGEIANEIPPRRLLIATGAASYPTVYHFAKRVEELCPSVSVEVIKIVNNFFGESVTVSGLLTGKDIYEQVKDAEKCDLLLLPSSCLRHGDDIFLCGMSLSELRDKLGVEIETVENDGYCFVEKLLGVNIN